MLDGIASLENLGDLFERASSSFDVEEVDECEFKHIPEDEEEVVLRGCKYFGKVIRLVDRHTFHVAPSKAIPVTKVL